MKKFLLAIVVLVSITSQAQTVATTNLTSHGKWQFVYEHTDAKQVAVGVYNKISEVKWQFIDSASGAIVKTDIFTHADTVFNTWYNGYNDFYWLYSELAAKEGLPVGDQAAIDASFANVIVPKPTFPKH
jgi:hypothetical protein